MLYFILIYSCLISFDNNSRIMTSQLITKKLKQTKSEYKKISLLKNVFIRGKNQ